MAADSGNPLHHIIRIAAKRQQLTDASALLRKHIQVFQKRAQSSIATLRDLKYKLRPLWLTLPVKHQIKVCVGSDSYGGNISCTARCILFVRAALS